MVDALKDMIAGIRAGGEQRAAVLARLKTVIIALIILVALGAPGVKLAAGERARLEKARDEAIALQQEASTLPTEKKLLNVQRARWDSAKEKLWQSAETGILLSDIESVTLKSGARLVSVKPGPRIEMFYRGHLRAVPVALGIYGPFPAVLQAVEELESLANPGEVRSFSVDVEKARSVESEPPRGAVLADVNLVLYSLNPPEVNGHVHGASGRYDPFWPLRIEENSAAESGQEAPAGSAAGGQLTPLEGQSSPAAGAPGEQGGSAAGGQASSGVIGS